MLDEKLSSKSSNFSSNGQDDYVNYKELAEKMLCEADERVAAWPANNFQLQMSSIPFKEKVEDWLQTYCVSRPVARRRFTETFVREETVVCNEIDEAESLESVDTEQYIKSNRKRTTTKITTTTIKKYYSSLEIDCNGFTTAENGLENRDQLTSNRKDVTNSVASKQNSNKMEMVKNDHNQSDNTLANSVTDLKTTSIKENTVSQNARNRERKRIPYKLNNDSCLVDKTGTTPAFEMPNVESEQNSEHVDNNQRGKRKIIKKPLRSAEPSKLVNIDMNINAKISKKSRVRANHRSTCESDYENPQNLSGVNGVSAGFSKILNFDSTPVDQDNTSKQGKVIKGRKKRSQQSDKAKYAVHDPKSIVEIPNVVVDPTIGSTQIGFSKNRTDFRRERLTRSATNSGNGIGSSNIKKSVNKIDTNSESDEDILLSSYRSHFKN